MQIPHPMHTKVLVRASIREIDDQSAAIIKNFGFFFRDIPEKKNALLPDFK